MSGRDEYISLRELWLIAWGGKWVIVAAGIALALGAAAYSLTAQKWYRAEVVLAPVEEPSALPFGGQLAGIASLVGIGGGSDKVVEAVATLRSRQFAQAFIEDRQLLPVFFADDWDATEGRWAGDDPAEWPDIRDAVKHFQEDMLSVNEDRQTGLVRLAVEWIDPELAAEWANDLANRVNAVMRERALGLSAANIKYLEQELTRAEVVELRETTSQLLAAEMKKMMFARGNQEYAFRIIDSATVPKRPVWPRPVLLVLLGGVLGASLGFVVTFVRHVMAARSEPTVPAGS